MLKAWRWQKDTCTMWRPIARTLHADEVLDGTEQSGMDETAAAEEELDRHFPSAQRMSNLLRGAGSVTKCITI